MAVWEICQTAVALKEGSGPLFGSPLREVCLFAAKTNSLRKAEGYDIKKRKTTKRTPMWGCGAAHKKTAQPKT